MSTQMPCVLLTWIKLKKNKIKPNLTKTLRVRLGVYKGMEQNGMEWIQQGKEQNGMEFKNLVWML